MKTSLRALLLDFDGVLADTEPVHLKMFQKILAGEGFSLSEADYYEKYLGLDDRSFFETFFREKGAGLSVEKKEELIRKKNREVLGEVGGKSFLLPGTAEFLRGIYRKYYLAVVSGALRSEIDAVLEGGGIADLFHTVVGAEDVSQGKPHPEGFLTAIRLLNRDHIPPSEILVAPECLAVEDSPWGIEAAKKAGVKCVAVTTSYPKEKLDGADLIAPNLPGLKWKEVEALF
jgi:HAD superfamily hydrolase (TIGR01509 family)